jgi:hypothetical protein
MITHLASFVPQSTVIHKLFFSCEQELEILLRCQRLTARYFTRMGRLEIEAPRGTLAPSRVGRRWEVWTAQFTVTASAINVGGRETAEREETRERGAVPGGGQ